MKKLGVIGGLGPMATAYFLERVTAMTDAKCDQEHIEILIHSKPQIADRTSFIIGKTAESPLPDLLEVGWGLKSAGAEIIAMPCITAHYFQKDLEDGIGLTVINALTKTADYLKNAGISSAGIMATDGTIESQLFQKALAEKGINAIAPSSLSQEKVMEIIYDEVKAGRKINMEKLHAVASELRQNGAEVILLGCTELSIAKKGNMMPAGYLDVLDVLARAAVMSCGRLKAEFDQLITED